MIALVQRVNHASVKVDGVLVSEIGFGLLVFVGVEKGDTTENAQALFEKLYRFRIFSDAAGRLNNNIEQAQGQLLIVPQFTLPAETAKGNRPGFERVADPQTGRQLFDELVEHFQSKTQLIVKTGVFQAEMKVLLENDGPLTFWLKK